MYSQRDPAWAGYLLGQGPDTIGADGCYLTSDADLMTWTGHPTDPAQLNQIYLAGGVYVQGELLADTALHVAFPDLWNLEEVYHCENTPCDQNQLNNDDPNLYVIVEMQGPDGLTHFSPVLNWRAWTVADAWTGSELTVGQVGANFGWGSDSATLIGRVMKLRYTGGTPTPPPPPPDATTFQGTVVVGGTHTRTLPGLDQPIIQQPGSNPDVVDGGTVLTFDGWTHHLPSGRVTQYGSDTTVPLDTAFNPPRPDDRWFRVQASGHWLASVGVDYANGADPPANLLVADPAPEPSPSPDVPVKGIPDAFKGVVVYETAPQYGPEADYAALAVAGVSGVLIRAANGDGTGKNDAVFEGNWAPRSAAAKTAEITPIPWTYWYGSSEGVSGDVTAYLMSCAEHTANLATDAPCWVVDVEDRSLPGLGQALAHLSAKSGKPVFVNPPGDPKTYGLSWDWASIDAAVSGYLPQFYTAAWGSAVNLAQAWQQMVDAGARAPFFPIFNETLNAGIVADVTAALEHKVEGICFWFWAGPSSIDQVRAYVAAWTPAPPPTPTPTPNPPPAPPPGALGWLRALLDWLIHLFGGG